MTQPVSEKISIKERPLPFDFTTRGGCKILMDLESLISYPDEGTGNIYQFIDEVQYSKESGNTLQEFLDNNKLNIVYQNFRKYLPETTCRILVNEGKIVFLTKSVLNYLHYQFTHDKVSSEKLNERYGINIIKILTDNKLPF